MSNEYATQAAWTANRLNAITATSYTCMQFQPKVVLYIADLFRNLELILGKFSFGSCLQQKTFTGTIYCTARTCLPQKYLSSC